MINNIEIQKSKIIKRRPKRRFSLGDKQKLYTQWKKSGLTMTKFCKEKDLVHSAFSNWRKKFSSGQTVKNKNYWMPVVTKEKTLENDYLPKQINLNVVTQILIILLLLFMVLDYAVKLIW